MKATAIAPSNIAFIKYWGKKDEKLRLPTNGSISMNLSGLLTTTTVEFSEKYKEDLVIIDDKKKENGERVRVIKHLDRIRKLTRLNLKAKVVSKNNFPSSTGLSSSASGFAALTLAATSAIGLNLSKRDLSILARLVSGSACRSIPDGFVEWFEGENNESSYAVSLFPPDYWDVYDVVVVVSEEKKEVRTTQGQKLVFSSPFIKERLVKIPEKIRQIKKLIKEKKFTEFGELVEAEALEMHAIIMTSIPPLVYWYPETVNIMRLVRKWRKEGFPVYFTINTGHDIHLICQKENVKKLTEKLKAVVGVKNVIINQPSNGARLVNNHLF